MYWQEAFDEHLPMNVLFITSNRLGDAVLSTGLLDHLIRQDAGLRVTVACGAVPASLFREMPGIERIIVLEKRPLAGHWLSLWAQTVGTAWHLIVDLRASAIAWLLKAKSRHVLDTGASRDSTHRVVQLAAVLGLDAALGLDGVPPPRIWLGDVQRNEASRLMPAGRPILAVGPTANWGGKQWRPELFADVIALLTAADASLDGADVAVFGAPDERAMAQPVLDSIPPERRVDLVGNDDLLVTAACLEHADLYIGNDSGLMHLAAAMGVPTLGLFGPSREVHYAPWGDHCAFVRTAKSYEEIVGDPAYDYRRHDTWMDTLSVDAVEDAAVVLWQRTRDAAASAGMMR
jgi:heptosyltransferase-3